MVDVPQDLRAFMGERLGHFQVYQNYSDFMYECGVVMTPWLSRNPLFTPPVVETQQDIHGCHNNYSIEFFYDAKEDAFTRWMAAKQAVQSDDGDEYYLRWSPQWHSFSIHEEAGAKFVGNKYGDNRVCVLFSYDRAFRGNEFIIYNEHVAIRRA